MFGLFQREKPSTGVVRFRGNIHPRAEEFAHLHKMGVEVRRKESGPEAHWHLRLQHPVWGRADVIAPRNAPPFPTEQIDFSNHLGKQERADAHAGGVELMVGVESKAKHVLRDRKHLLRYMRAIMGEEGVLAFDTACGGCWSKRRLDEELSHDADLDISSIFTYHAVCDDGWKPGKDETPDDAPVEWLHTHGLGELGAFDFDILRPHPSVTSGIGQDAMRAVAFGIVEGEVKPDTPKWVFVGPNEVVVRLVPVEEFQAKAAEKHRVLRSHDEHHSTRRAVICEPSPSGLAFWRSGAPEPSRALQRELPEQGIMHFSEKATEAMAVRARGTLGVLQGFMHEFREFELPTIAKMGYKTDRGQGSEHLWFTLHGVTDAGLDATLDSQPFDIKSLKPGQREVRPVDRLTDWAIMTPVGMITPRDFTYAHAMRAMGPMLLEILKKENPKS